MVIKISALDHVVLRTTKLEQMLRFYCDLLGCTVERELPPETGLVQLRAGTALIDIVTVNSELGRLGGGPPTPHCNNLDHFCLQIEPVSETAVSRYLKSNGVDAPEFSERYGAEGFGPSIYIKDPEGNTVELKFKLPEMAQPE